MIYSVIVDISASEIDRIFDYKGENYQVGERVLVDFGNRKRKVTLWLKRIKPIVRRKS